MEVTARREDKKGRKRLETAEFAQILHYRGIKHTENTIMSTNYYLQKILTEEEREKIVEAAKRCRLHSALIREIDAITGNETMGNSGDTTQRIHIGKRVEDRFIFALSLASLII